MNFFKKLFKKQDNQNKPNEEDNSGEKEYPPAPAQWSAHGIMILLLFLLTLHSLAQKPKQRLILRDHHIKRILTFYKDSLNDPGYLSGIDFINDSGLVVKIISLNDKHDTTAIITYKYNEQNLEVYSELTSRGKTTIWTTSYKQPSKSIVEYTATSTRDGVIKTVTTKLRDKETKKELKSWYYKDGKLIERRITKGNMSIAKFKIYNGNKGITKFYLDSSKNVIQSISTIYGKKNKGISEETTSGAATVTNKRKLKKDPIHIQIIDYEYNEIGLVKKEIMHFQNATYSYQYLTE